MTNIFGDLQGEAIKGMRVKLRNMSDVLKKDRESGASFEAIKRISQLGR